MTVKLYKWLQYAEAWPWFQHGFFPLKVCLVLWMVAFCPLKQATNRFYSGLEFLIICAAFHDCTHVNMLPHVVI